MIRVTFTLELADGFYMDPEELEKLCTTIASTAVNTSPNKVARISYKQEPVYLVTE